MGTGDRKLVCVCGVWGGWVWDVGCGQQVHEWCAARCNAGVRCWAPHPAHLPLVVEGR
jgi:hypothetical protein